MRTVKTRMCALELPRQCVRCHGAMAQPASEHITVSVDETVYKSTKTAGPNHTEYEHSPRQFMLHFALCAACAPIEERKQRITSRVTGLVPYFVLAAAVVAGVAAVVSMWHYQLVYNLFYFVLGGLLGGLAGLVIAIPLSGMSLAIMAPDGGSRAVEAELGAVVVSGEMSERRENEFGLGTQVVAHRRLRRDEIRFTFLNDQYADEFRRRNALVVIDRS